MAGYKIAKSALRKEIKGIIAKLSEAEKCKQSISVTRQLLLDSSYINAKSISIYLHMDDEIKTIDILEDALRYCIFVSNCYITEIESLFHVKLTRATSSY